MGATAGQTTAQLQHWLELLRAGDRQARHELLHHACERLRRLTRRMLRHYPLVQQREQTDDVLQNALMRLYRTLADVTPESLRHFFNLAALQIRRELLDLAKRTAGPESLAARESESGHHVVDRADRSEAPETLLEWTEFHTAVEALPEEDREVFNLLWYEGLAQAEAASLLGVTERTIKRRWKAARIRLYQALQGEPPQTG